MPEDPTRAMLVDALIAELLAHPTPPVRTPLGDRIAGSLAEAVAMAPLFAAGVYRLDAWIAHRVAMIEREERP